MKFYNFSTSTYRALSSTYSFDHEMSFSLGYPITPGLVVGVSIFGNGTVTSIRCADAGLTQWRDMIFVRADTNGSYRSEIWYKTGVYIGDNTIEVNLSAALASITGCAAYDCLAGIGTHDGATGTGTPAAKALTPLFDKSIVFVNLATLTPSGVTDASGQHNRYNAQGALGSQRGSDIGIVSPPASTTLQYNNIGALDAWAMSSVELLGMISNPSSIMS